ncbi:fungal-specific transcription factor domain-containing protein [Bisporella sp. PMI_857]|nr:fungal-specific transcription factor domain-containing protein [Bisporella sp. PMI_857]
MINRDAPDVPQRYPLSCVLCHRRKIKCDRLVEGCGNCAKARTVCIYPETKIAPKRARTRPSLQSKEHAKRERELERKLKVLEAKVHILATATIGSQISNKSPSPAIEGGSVGELKLNVGAVRRDGKISVRPFTVGQVAAGDTVQSDTTGQIVSNRTITDQFWQNFTGEVENIEELLDGLSIDNQSPFNLASISQQGFLFGYHSSMVNLYPLHPGSNYASRYWQLYVENIDPVTKILHVPSFEKKFNDAHKDLQRLEAGSEALMFSIYYSVISSLSVDMVQAEFKESRDNLLKKYQFGIEQALSKAKFMKSKELAPLQALTLYLICQVHEDEDIFWTMTGLTIRLAQNLRIHRDGTTFNLSPFEVEMRRRLWWHICALDCRAAEGHGSVSSISDGMFDAKLPLNIDDTDISPDATDPARSKKGRTDMSFCFTVFLITRTMCRLNHQLLGGHEYDKFGVNTIEEKLKMVEEYRQTIEEYSFHDIHSPRLIDWVTIALSKMMLRKMWLSIYHPPYRSSTDIIPPEARSKLLLISLEVIERSRSLETEQSAQQWAWLFRSYVQWHAIAYLLAGLCQPQQYELDQEFINRAWHQLDCAFQERNGGDGRNAQEGKLWLALTKLFNRAKAVRENAELGLANDRPEVSQQTNDSSYQDRAEKYGSLTTATNNSPPQYRNRTYETIGAAREEILVPIMTTSLPLNRYQSHSSGVYSNDSAFSTQQVTIDTYDTLLASASYANFPIVAMNNVNNANHQFDLSASSNYSAANLDWQQWDTVMRDLQFDVNSNGCK